MSVSDSYVESEKKNFIFIAYVLLQHSFLCLFVVKVNVGAGGVLILLQQQDKFAARVIHLDQLSALVHAIVDLKLLCIAESTANICLHLVVQWPWGIVQSLDIVRFLGSKITS